jgi:hypothetical protein
MTTMQITIKVKQLPEDVFLATSDDAPGLTVECETRDGNHRDRAGNSLGAS